MRPPPGTIGQLNQQCPWPERRGSLCIVVDTTGAERQYPVHGLGKNEVIVLVTRDALTQRPSYLSNGQPWSCATSIDSIDIVREAAP